jgi:hypothetical protein
MEKDIERSGLLSWRLPGRPEKNLNEVCFSFLGVGWDWVHLVRRSLIGLSYQPRMIDDYEAFGVMRIGRGNRSTRKKTCPSATLSTTNPTWPDLGSNPGRRGVKPATNRLSYGTAWTLMNLNQIDECPNRNSNPAPVEYKSRALLCTHVQIWPICPIASRTAITWQRVVTASWSQNSLCSGLHMSAATSSSK